MSTTTPTANDIAELRRQRDEAARYYDEERAAHDATRSELAVANRRIEQMDDILCRKNRTIRLLALGDMPVGAEVTAAIISEEHSLP